MKFRSFFLTLTLLPLVAFAAPGGIGSSLQKGLVGHWPLTGESEKVGNNLVTSNGDFEIDSNSDGLADNWIALGTTTPTYSRVTGNGFTGNAQHMDFVSGFARLKKSTITLAPQTSYLLNFKYRSSVGFNASLDGHGGTFIYVPANTGNAISYSIVFNYVPLNSAELLFQLGAAGWIEIDDVIVKELKTADTTPYDNHGTIYGATSTTGPSGETDGAMSFDGSLTQKISIPEQTQLTTGNPITLAAWVRPESTGNYRTIMGNSSIHRLLINSNGTMLSQQDGNFLSDAGVVPNSVWIHVVYWFDGTKERWYINGIQSGVDHSTTSVEWTGTFFIGQYDSVNYPYKGSISDVRIYNRALTADEVAQLYNQGGKTVVTQKPSLETGLVGHWPLNGESEAWTELTGDAWQNSTAYGRTTGTNYFSQAGNTIEVVNTGSSWFGAGKMYATSEKGKYKIHIKTNTFNGLFKPAFHLYYAGSRVSYTAVQVPATPTFTSNHPSGFNYASKSTGPYEATDIIDLTNAPNFDAIHVALLSESGTSSPYIQFQSTDIFVKQLVTADTTPYDNHGKINGATLTTGPREETNGAMSGNIIIPDANNLDFNNTDFSISTWVKLNELTNVSGILAKNPSGNAGLSNYALWKYPNTIRFFIGTGNGGEYEGVSSNSLNQGEWYFITATFNSATNKMRMYTNGLFQNETTATYNPSANNGILNLGSLGGGSFFNGNISDLRIYNRVLTTQEITQLYEEKAKIMGNKLPSLESGLVGHWPLSGGYTNPSVFADITPYDNHGTFYGTTLTTGIHGEAGGARSFDGIDDYVALPNELMSTSTIRTQGISYAAWIKTDNNSVSQRILGQKPSSGYSDYSSGGIGISSEGKAQMIAYDDNISYKYAIGTTKLENNTWYFISGTYSAEDQSIRVYVNGNLEGTPVTITTFSRLTLNADNRIGISTHSTQPLPFNGSIADARIYNRALSADEIKRLYEVR